MIGVLTWKLYNFGTALQAFALVEFVSMNSKSKGCKLLNYSLPGRNEIVQVNNLTFVDYINKINNRISVWKKDKRNRKDSLRFTEEIVIQKKKFREFYNCIPHDNHNVNVTEMEYFNSNFEKIIVGSDQVWNPRYFCETYFLNFIRDSKKYSYAPSLGVSCLTREEEGFLKSKLKGHFQQISVREKTGKILLDKIIPEQQVECVVDPTLLFTGEQWCEKLKLHENIDQGRYILVYTLSDNIWYKDAIKRVSRELGVRKIIYITSEYILYFYANEAGLKVDVGPIEFLNLMKNAEFIITDSFHGACFSLNFEKQFICLSRFREKNKKSENSRIVDILKQLDIWEKVYFNNSNIDINMLNYEEINKKLNVLRNHSIKYLNRSIIEKDSSEE